MEFRLMLKQIVIGLMFISSAVAAQEVMSANPEKLQTIDGTIDELLRVVNGEKGKQRNWEAFKNLFIESCNFTVVYGGNSTPFETASIEDMVEFMQDDYYDNGYKEEKLQRQIKTFNGIAHVFEIVKHTEPDGTVVKGLNSYQLVFGNERWYITGLVWTAESDEAKIPATFLDN